MVLGLSSYYWGAYDSIKGGITVVVRRVYICSSFNKELNCFNAAYEGPPVQRRTPRLISSPDVDVCSIVQQQFSDLFILDQNCQMQGAAPIPFDPWVSGKESSIDVSSCIDVPPHSLNIAPCYSLKN